MNRGELFDSKGNFIMKYSKNHKANMSQRNWIQKTDGKKLTFRKMVIVIIAILYFLYGMIICSLVFDFFSESERYCSMVREQRYEPYFNTSLTEKEKNILLNNPELFVWDYCNYQVYPFDNHNPCNCRVFELDWYTMLSTEKERMINFNITQDQILNSLLSKWFMLEKFKTSHDATGVVYQLNATHLKAIKMKAFEWNYAKLSYIDDKLSEWKSLEYFKLEETLVLNALPSGFKQLTLMKLINFAETGLLEFPTQICYFKELLVLQFSFELNLNSIPFCVGKLENLIQFIIDNSVGLVDIPIQVFNFKNILEFSLFNADITYDNILSYNNITDLKSFDLQWNTDPGIKYYLAGTSICDDDISSMHSSFQNFIQSTDCCHQDCDYNNKTSAADSFCSPVVYGDGKCDRLCSNQQCFNDGGDCSQLCFVKPYSNCTFELFSDDVCHDECDNFYCLAFSFGFVYDENIHGNMTMESLYEIGSFMSGFTPGGCYLHVHREFEQYVCIGNTVDDKDLIKWNSLNLHCMNEWSNDGLCDASCNVEECDFDGGDCIEGCIDDICATVYQAWNFLFGIGTVKINITGEFCGNNWNVALMLIDRDPDKMSCNLYAPQFDFNQDHYLNFREFVALGTWLVDSPDQCQMEDIYEPIKNNNPHCVGARFLQMDCSSCMDDYNV
eukprot:268632_1